MPLTHSDTESTLRSIVESNTGKDLLSIRAARNVVLDGDAVSLDIELGYPRRCAVKIADLQS